MRARRILQPGVLQGAEQVEFVDALGRDRDANSVPVHLRSVAQRRTGGHQVGRVYRHVGGAEIDLARARRLGRQECRIERAGFEPFHHRRGGRVTDQLDRHARPPAQFARQVHVHAAELSIRLPDGEDHVAVVDPDAQLARRRELGPIGGGYLQRRHTGREQ